MLLMTNTLWWNLPFSTPSSTYNFRRRQKCELGSEEAIEAVEMMAFLYNEGGSRSPAHR